MERRTSRSRRLKRCLARITILRPPAFHQPAKPVVRRQPAFFHPALRGDKLRRLTVTECDGAGLSSSRTSTSPAASTARPLVASHSRLASGSSRRRRSLTTGRNSGWDQTDQQRHQYRYADCIPPHAENGHSVAVASKKTIVGQSAEWSGQFRSAFCVAVRLHHRDHPIQKCLAGVNATLNPSQSERIRVPPVTEAKSPPDHGSPVPIPR